MSCFQNTRIFVACFPALLILLKASELEHAIADQDESQQKSNYLDIDGRQLIHRGTGASSDQGRECVGLMQTMKVQLKDNGTCYVRLPSSQVGSQICLTSGRASWISQRCTLRGPALPLPDTDNSVWALNVEECLSKSLAVVAKRAETHDRQGWVAMLRKIQRDARCEHQGRYVNAIVAEGRDFVLLEAVGPSVESLIEDFRWPYFSSDQLLLLGLSHFILGMMAGVVHGVNAGMQAAGFFHDDMKEPNVALALHGLSRSWPPSQCDDRMLSKDFMAKAHWVLIDWDSGISSPRPCGLYGHKLEGLDEESDIPPGFHYGCELAKAALRLVLSISLYQKDPCSLRLCLIKSHSPLQYELIFHEFAAERQPCRQQKYLPALWAIVETISACLTQESSLGKSEPVVSKLVHAISELSGAKLASLSEGKRRQAGCWNWSEWEVFFANVTWE